MKDFIFIGLTAILLLPFAGNAQMKINSNSQTIVGGEISSDDVAPLWVKGSLFSSSAYPAKIGIGLNPNDLRINEQFYGFPMLEVYAHAGMIFRSKCNGNVITFLQYYGIGGVDRLTANSNEFTFRYGTCIDLTETSDGRFKKDVKPLSSPLSQLSKLRGVSYLRDFSEHSQYGNQKRTIPGTEYEIDINPLQEDKSRHIGFIAQELQEVFPELVKADEDGNLSVHYTGLIPVVVEAMKEQQQELKAQKELITAQSEKINELRSEVEALRTGTTPKQAKGTEAIDAFLYQNAPNPFNTVTMIRYFLSGEAANASLYIFDMQGKLVESHPVSGAGEGSIGISASGLTPGMYLYSLLVNNREVDTKRMVITE